MSTLNTAATAAVQAATPAEATPTKAPTSLVDAKALDAAQAATETKEADTVEPSKSEIKAIEKQLKKYKVKVDGKEYEEELDLNDEAAVGKHIQMSKAAQRKMQEASDMRKAAEEFINLLRTDPEKVLRDPNINVDLKKLAQDVINREIEDASKSPEQLEKEKLQRELTDIKAKIEEDEKKRQSSELQRLQAEQQQKIEINIESALKTSDLPKTPYTVRKMAEMMLVALQNNVDLSPADLVPLIRKQMQNDIKELFGASSDDVLEELVGKDRISKLRKKKVAELQKQVAQGATTSNSVKTSGAKPAAPVEKVKIKMKDWLNR